MKQEERTLLKGRRLNKEELTILHQGRCPDCEQALLEGPSGGLSINMLCSNDDCGSAFNDMFVFGAERLSAAQPKKPTEKSKYAYR